MLKTKLLIVVMAIVFCGCQQIDDIDTNFYVEKTLVFDGISPKEWTELDLSDAVGENFAQATLKIYNEAGWLGFMAYFRQKGDESDYTFMSDTENMVSVGYSGVGQTIVYTNEFGVIEWKSLDELPVIIEVVAYVK